MGCSGSPGRICGHRARQASRIHALVKLCAPALQIWRARGRPPPQDGGECEPRLVVDTGTTVAIRRTWPSPAGGTQRITTVRRFELRPHHTFDETGQPVVHFVPELIVEHRVETVPPPAVLPDDLDRPLQDAIETYVTNPNAPNAWNTLVQAVAVDQASEVRGALQAALDHLSTDPSAWASLVNDAHRAQQLAQFVSPYQALETALPELRTRAAVADPAWARVELDNLLDDPTALERFLSDAEWGFAHSGSDGRLSRRLDVIASPAAVGPPTATLVLDGEVLSAEQQAEYFALAHAAGWTGSPQSLAYAMQQADRGVFIANNMSPEATFLNAVENGWSMQHPTAVPAPVAPTADGAPSGSFIAINAFRHGVTELQSTAVVSAGVSYGDAYRSAITELDNIRRARPELVTLDLPALFEAYASASTPIVFHANAEIVRPYIVDVANPEAITSSTTQPFRAQVEAGLVAVDNLIQRIETEAPTADDLLLVNQLALNYLHLERLDNPAAQAAFAIAQAEVIDIFERAQREQWTDLGLVVVGVAAGIAAPLTGGGSLALFLLATSLTAGVAAGARAVDRFYEQQRRAAFNLGDLVDLSGVESPSAVWLSVELALVALGVAADAFAIARVLRSISVADDAMHLAQLADDLERVARWVTDVVPAGTDASTVTRIAAELGDPTLRYVDLSPVTRQFLADEFAIYPNAHYVSAGQPQRSDDLLTVFRHLHIDELSPEVFISVAAEGGVAGIDQARAAALVESYLTRGTSVDDARLISNMAMLDGGPLGRHWQGALNTLIEDNSRGLSAIIADPSTPPHIRAQALSDLDELYRRYGVVLRSAEGDVVSGDELARFNAWLQDTLPEYQPHFEASTARGFYNPNRQVTMSNEAATDSIAFLLALRSVDLHPGAFVAATQGDGALHVVGLLNGGGGVSGAFWDDVVATGIDLRGGRYGSLVPVARQGSTAASDFALSFTPAPGDTIVLVDDLITSGRTAENAIRWIQANHPDVEILIIARAGGNTIAGTPTFEWTQVYGR